MSYEYPNEPTQPMQAVPPPKPRRTLRLVLLVAGLIVGLCCIGGGVVAAINGGDSTDGDTQDRSLRPSESVATEAQPTEEAEPETEPEPEPEWVEVAEVSGSGDKATEPFDLEGGQLRVSWECEDTGGLGVIVMAVYILPEGHDFNTEGGIPDAMAAEPGSDSAVLYRDAGSYYLNVIAANCAWTVTVEELR